MLLRESGRAEKTRVDPNAVMLGEEIRSGVKGGAELIAFADAVVKASPELTRARDAMAKALGEEALVDAAAVVGNFQRMVRIADGTGIPLDTQVAMMTQELRETLELNSFGSASNTPALTRMQAFWGRLLRPVVPLIMRRMAARAK